MDQKLSHEIGLLRQIVKNLVIKPLPHGPVSTEILHATGLIRARIAPDGLAGISRPGVEPFVKLCELMSRRSPELERGIAFETFQEEYFSALLNNFLERDPESISAGDVQTLEQHLVDWFSKQAVPRTIFVPCMISPWPSPRFSVGPVTFIFINALATSEYFPKTGSAGDLNLFYFQRLVDTMRKEHAHWLAIVNIEGCDRGRAFEVGNLAIDLAIVALQLAAPYSGTKNMSRLATRRGPGNESTFSLSQGNYSTGWMNKEPGTLIGEGFLEKIVSDTSALITAVGDCVRSFTTGSFRLPKLEQAWCDAAYWLHQGLAEPLDSIALAKFETALEVLFTSESTSGSERRIRTALEAFFQLKPNDPINGHTQITAKQFAKALIRDRSRVLHGTWSTLTTRLHSSRQDLENLAVMMLRESVVALDAYTRLSAPADDIEAFLDWVKRTRLHQVIQEQR